LIVLFVAFHIDLLMIFEFLYKFFKFFLNYFFFLGILYCSYFVFVEVKHVCKSHFSHIITSSYFPLDSLNKQVPLLFQFGPFCFFIKLFFLFALFCFILFCFLKFSSCLLICWIKNSSFFFKWYEREVFVLFIHCTTLKWISIFLCSLFFLFSKCICVHALYVWFVLLFVEFHY